MALIWNLCFRCSGWISGVELVGKNKPVAAISFVIGALFDLMAAVCFILLVRVC